MTRKSNPGIQTILGWVAGILFFWLAMNNLFHMHYGPMIVDLLIMALILYFNISNLPKRLANKFFSPFLKSSKNFKQSQKISGPYLNQIDIKSCPQCGTEIENWAKICPNCLYDWESPPREGERLFRYLCIPVLFISFSLIVIEFLYIFVYSKKPEPLGIPAKHVPLESLGGIFPVTFFYIVPTIITLSIVGVNVCRESLIKAVFKWSLFCAVLFYVPLVVLVIAILTGGPIH